MKKFIAAILVIAGLTLLATTANALEPGWSGPIIARGRTRQQIESTPIAYRSYRPFHFYGNTVRRVYYRGTFLLNSRDIMQGGAVLLRPTQFSPGL